MMSVFESRAVLCCESRALSRFVLPVALAFSRGSHTLLRLESFLRLICCLFSFLFRRYFRTTKRRRQTELKSRFRTQVSPADLRTLRVARSMRTGNVFTAELLNLLTCIPQKIDFLAANVSSMTTCCLKIACFHCPAANVGILQPSRLTFFPLLCSLAAPLCRPNERASELIANDKIRPNQAFLPCFPRTLVYGGLLREVVFESVATKGAVLQRCSSH